MKKSPVQTHVPPVTTTSPWPGGYAQFRQEIEPELAKLRLKPPAPEEKGNLLNPKPKHQKMPKTSPYRKRKAYGPRIGRPAKHE